MRLLRARYIELAIHDEDQTQENLELNLLMVTTQDGEKVGFDKDVLRATYIPIHETTVDFSEGVG